MYKKTFFKKWWNTKNKSGFTILFAVLVSSILLAVGASVFSITVKNLLFSSAGRESLRAFSAADTGLECAEYWDKEGGGIFGAHDRNPDSVNDTNRDAQCLGKKIYGTDVQREIDIIANGGGYTTTLKINTENNGVGICVDVIVTKKPKTDDPTKTTTVIDSRGYNTCVLSDRRLERAVRLTYDEL